VINLTENESASLIGYAILKARYDGESRAYIDNFEQFVLAVVNNNDSGPISVKVVAERVKKVFGIEIPVEVVKRIGRRAFKRGYLKRDSDGRFLCLTQKGKDDLPDLDGEIASYRRAEAVLEDGLRKCVAQICDDDTEMAAIDWKRELKKYIESRSVDIIRYWRNGSVQGSDEEGAQQLTRDERVHYIISKYVASMYVSASQSFESLVSLAQGVMLSTLLEGSSWDEIPKIDSLKVALDTSIVLDLLELHGAERYVAAHDVLKMIHANGIDCFVLQSTLNEVDTILRGVEEVLQGQREFDRPVGVLEYAIQNSLKPSDLAILRDSVGSGLSKLSVYIEENPPFDRIYCLDEGRLRTVVQESVNYKSAQALDQDVCSLSAIHRLRRGRGGSTMEKARYLFVTANTAIVQGCDKFAREERYLFPLAVSFEYIATRLWLRAPLVSSNVPKDLLVASAYAGLKPKPKVWDEVLKNIDQAVKDGVIGDDEARILRLRSETGDLYMQQLVSGQEVDSRCFVFEAIEQFKNEIRAPLESKNRERAEEISKLSQSSSREIELLKSQLEAKSRSVEQSEAQAHKWECRYNKLSDRVHLLDEKAQRKDRESAEAVWEAKVQTRAVVFRFVFFCAFCFLLFCILIWAREGFSDWKQFVWAAVAGLPSFIQLVSGCFMKKDFSLGIARFVMRNSKSN